MNFGSTDKIMVLKSRHKGMDGCTYKDEISAVIGMLDNGSLGGGGSYGDEKHIAALDKIVHEITNIRLKIELSNSQENNCDSDNPRLTGEFTSPR